MGDAQRGKLDNAVAVIAAFALCIGIKPKKRVGHWIWIDLQPAAKIRFNHSIKGTVVEEGGVMEHGVSCQI